MSDVSKRALPQQNTTAVRPLFSPWLQAHHHPVVRRPSLREVVAVARPSTIACRVTTSFCSRLALTAALFMLDVCFCSLNRYT